MEPTWGWTLAVGGMLMLAITWVRLQRSVSQVVADMLTVTAGVLTAIGGLLVLTDVSTASWIVAPVCCGGGAWLHRRVLFHGAGPLRT